MGESWVLLDATYKHIPLPLLPIADLNSKGLLVTMTGHRWLNMDTANEGKKIAQLILNLDDSGELTGTVKMRHSGYAACDLREAVLAEDDEAAYWSSWTKDHASLRIAAPEISGLDNIYDDVECSLQLEGSEAVTALDDYIYISPLLLWQMTENPFKLEKREYPVDFPYPQSVLYSLQLTIPEGYTVEELPESARLALPEKAGDYLLSVSNNGNVINVLSKFNLSRTMFMTDSYVALREFYDLIVDMEAAQIVLRKKS